MQQQVLLHVCFFIAFHQITHLELKYLISFMPQKCIEKVHLQPNETPFNGYKYNFSLLTCMKWSARKSGVILKIIKASKIFLLNSKYQTLTARQTGVNPLVFYA